MITSEKIVRDKLDQRTRILCSTSGAHQSLLIRKPIEPMSISPTWVPVWSERRGCRTYAEIQFAAYNTRAHLKHNTNTCNGQRIWPLVRTRKVIGLFDRSNHAHVFTVATAKLFSLRYPWLYQSSYPVSQSSLVERATRTRMVRTRTEETCGTSDATHATHATHATGATDMKSCCSHSRILSTR